MRKIIAVTNQKGGVGKTTTSINLSASLAAHKRRVLLVDLDPQGNATTGSGIEKNALESTIGDVLVGEVAVQDVIQRSPQGKYDVVPANIDLTAADVALTNEIGRELRLKKALEEVASDYDQIIIDCPPSLNILTVNAMVAAQSVLIPMQCEYYALEGLSALLHTIEQIKTAVNPELEVEGVLRTMYDARSRLSLEVTEQLQRYFGDKVYRTVVPRNIRLAEAPSYGVPVIIHDKTCRGAVAYLSLVGEMLKRHEQEQQNKQIV